MRQMCARLVRATLVVALFEGWDESRRAATRAARTNPGNPAVFRRLGVLKEHDDQTLFFIRPRLRVGLKDQRFFWETAITRRGDVSKAQLQNLRVGLTGGFRRMLGGFVLLTTNRVTST